MQEFYASNVLDAMLAWEGYAQSHGLKPAFDPNDYPDEDSRNRLRQKYG